MTAYAVSARVRYAVLVCCVLWASARCGSATAQSLFGEGEIRIPPGGEETAVFELGARSLVELRFRARSDSDRLGGMLPMLYVRVNEGPMLGADRLLGRPGTLQFGNGEEAPVAPRQRFTLYHAPSFEPLPTDYRYLPVNAPGNDPFTFRLDISDLVRPGVNRVVFKHFKPHTKYNMIVIRDAAVHLGSLDDLLAVRAENVRAEAERMRAVRLGLYSDTPAVDDTPEMLGIMRGMRLSTWGYWNSGDLNEFPTPEAAAARARELKANGATVAIVRGRHYRLHYLEETERLLAYYRTAAEACHEVGLACFAHFDFVLTWQAGFPFLKAHDQLPQRSLHDGTPTRWLCCNNPALREAHTRYIEDIARQGIDGFMLDEINFAFKSHLHCGCEHCRALFEEKTGFRLPEWDDRTVIGNPDSALWRLWQEWQAQSLTQFRLQMVRRIRAIRPGAVILVYSTNIYFPTDCTNSILENARVCFAGTEGSNLTYAGAPNLFAQHRIARAFTDLYGRPAWAQYPAGSTAERVFGSVYLAPVTGNRPWGWLRQTDDPAFARFFSWYGLDESLVHAEPVADVGVLVSTVNRHGPAERGHVHSAEVSGWLQAFGLSGIGFNPVVGKYAAVSDLARYRAVVVPDCRMLPEPTVRAVADFARGGGTLLVTGVPGRFDALGFPLGDASLLRRLGIRTIRAVDDMRFDRKKQAFMNGIDRELVLEPEALAEAPRRVHLPASYAFEVELSTDTDREVMARFGDRSPAVIAWPYGEGRIVYVCFLPGQLFGQRRCTRATVVEAWHQPDVLALIRALALEAVAGENQVRLDGEGVLSSAWRKGNLAWVRMVNVSGLRNLPVGEPIGKIEPDYPSLDLLQVRVTLPVGGTAQLVGPELDGPLDISATLDPGGTRFEIPPGTFSTSAFLRMELLP